MTKHAASDAEPQRLDIQERNNLIIHESIGFCPFFFLSHKVNGKVNHRDHALIDTRP
jgi:hypothetical protein